MTQKAATRRHTSGLIVVILLGVIFFVLLALLIVYSGKPKPVPQAKAETLTVLPIRVRLRTEPNTKAAVVATATSGEQLTQIEDRGAWVHVQNSEGLVGWAERNNLERTSERERRVGRYAEIKKLPSLAGSTIDRTPLYAGPGIFYPLIGELPEGSDVKVFTRDHDFYAIEYVDTIAYAGIDTIDVRAARGTPQLDVATGTSTAAPTETATTDTSAAQQPASTFPTETIPPPPPPVLPPPEAPAGGVYAAVPQGGTQPEEVDRVIPRYPAAARAAGAAGAVVIRGIVRRDGTIDNVEIIKDLPNGLGEAALDAVRRWRFRPATFRGDPIDVYYTVTVNFRLR